MSEKPSKPPAVKRGENENVVPLRKGVLAPKSSQPGSVYFSFGVEGEDFVVINPDGSIEREKL